MKNKSNKPTVTKIIVRDEVYSVHTVREPEGYSGYVIHDGEFFLTLPTVQRESTLFNEAERRIKEIT